jgi:hypothetical protein
MAVANDVNDEEDHVLTEVFKQCEELRAKTYLETAVTPLRARMQSFGRKYSAVNDLEAGFATRAIFQKAEPGIDAASI